MAQLIVPLTDEEKAERIRKARALKMVEIGKESVKSRDRKFDAYPHVPIAAHAWGRFGDLQMLLAAGRRAVTDTWYTRNLVTGDYERVVISDLIDEMEAVAVMREKMREVDQAARDRVDEIYNDAAMTPEQKESAIEAMTIPEFLDIDTTSTAEKLEMKRKA